MIDDPASVPGLYKTGLAGMPEQYSLTYRPVPTMGPLSLLTLLALSASAYGFTAQRVSTGTSVTTNTILPPAQAYTRLTGTVPRSSYKKNLLRQLRSRGGQASNTTAVVAGADYDQEYLTSITIGGQNFDAIIDTGSSDTWLAKVGYKCFDLDGNSVPTSQCDFGSAGFDPSKSKTFTTAANKNFNISYGDGEFLTGTVGYDTVTVGGLAVTQQEIGVVNNAAWEGDGYTSGLIGLAFPDLTSVYTGTNPNKDSASNSAPYNPFFFTAVQEKAVANPYFSVALNRGTFAQQENDTYDANLGYLAFGGIAPVGVTSTAATVPIQGYSVSSGGSGYLFYTVDIDSYVFPGSTKVSTKGTTAILDTGTTLNYVPTKVAQAYNAQFKPPATFNADEDTYYVSCNATVPAWSTVIGGQSFAIAAADQILPAGTDDNGVEQCISGTQDGGAVTADNIFIMGDVFLHNVVATFNIQSNQITLTERSSY